jgi:hypothetical protein
MPIAIGALVWAALVMFMVIAPAPSLAPVWVIAGWSSAAVCTWLTVVRQT